MRQVLLEMDPEGTDEYLVCYSNRAALEEDGVSKEDQMEMIVAVFLPLSAYRDMGGANEMTVTMQKGDLLNVGGTEVPGATQIGTKR